MQEYDAHKLITARNLPARIETGAQGAPASDLTREITSLEGSEDHIESCPCKDDRAEGKHVRRSIYDQTVPGKCSMVKGYRSRTDLSPWRH